MRVFASHAVEPDTFAGKHQKAPGPFPMPVAPVSVTHREGALLQRKSNCACGGGCPGCAQEKQPEAIQTKLQVSTPGDQYEQEADRVAEQVMRMPDRSGHASVNVSRRFSNLQLQPKGAACADSQPGASHEDEENLQAKEITGEAPYIATKTQSQIDALRGGGGHALPSGVRAFFEPRFNQDFGEVRVHADARAAESARAVKAQAYTVGHDIVFGNGHYAPDTTQGRLLLAHELTHVVQQSGAGATLQRQHVADTGFRYKPPATVTRSIIEIQGIVGTTPDGDYGENTKIAVQKYQTKLKAAGLYTDTVDGKWGDKTDTAHVAFATAPNGQKRGYNCAGFAFKDYTWHDMAPTRAIYGTMTKLADCSKACSPYFHKFWMWEFDIKTVKPSTGQSSPTWRDFHTVGGQTNGKGNGPNQVMSKDGQRPVVGPKPPLDFKPIDEPVVKNDGTIEPDAEWVVSNMQEDCYCSDKLP